MGFHIWKPRLRGHHRTGGRKLVSAIGWEGQGKVMSSGHDMVIIHMNSRQLCSPVQDQASQNSSMDRGEAAKTPHLAEEVLVVDGC